MKPSTWLPESPMKTAAGLPGRRLNGRNPRQDRPSASESTRRSRSGCTVTASIAKNVAPIMASVPARPSMLSSRLSAFVIPTSQTTPIAAASTLLPTISTERPVASAIAAAPNWTASLTAAGSERMSSIRPATKRSVAAARIPSSSSWSCTAPAAIAAPMPAASPRKRPIPPKVGVSCSLQRSPVGWAINRRATGDRSRAQMTKALTGRATAAAAALIDTEPGTG